MRLYNNIFCTITKTEKLLIINFAYDITQTPKRNSLNDSQEKYPPKMRIMQRQGVTRDFNHFKICYQSHHFEYCESFSWRLI